MIGIFDEGIHEPELDGFDILGFEIGIIKFTHDATPTAARLCKGTLSGKSCAELGRSDIEVVGAAFFGIKGHIKLIDICELALCQLLIREDLLLIYATGIGSGTVLLVDVAGAIGTVEYTNTCKENIDAARLAYNNLDNDDQKNLVTNYTTLTRLNM